MAPVKPPCRCSSNAPPALTTGAGSSEHPQRPSGPPPPLSAAALHRCTVAASLDLAPSRGCCCSAIALCRVAAPRWQPPDVVTAAARPPDVIEAVVCPSDTRHAVRATANSVDLSTVSTARYFRPVDGRAVTTPAAVPSSASSYRRWSWYKCRPRYLRRPQHLRRPRYLRPGTFAGRD